MNGRISFYDDLTGEQDRVEETFYNLCVLRYIQGDDGIDVSEYELEARKKLYLLAQQANVMKKLYSIIYKDASFTSTYTTQYNEIMSIVNSTGGESIDDVISEEELAEALVLILSAGGGAIYSLANSTKSPYDKHFINLYGYGKAYFTFSPNGFLVSGPGILYFSDGEPFSIKGYYVYKGKILNGTEGMDAATAIEEAKWIKNNYGDDFYHYGLEHMNNLDAALSGN